MARKKKKGKGVLGIIAYVLRDMIVYEPGRRRGKRRKRRP